MATGPSNRNRKISLLSLMTSGMGTVWLRWTRTDGQLRSASGSGSAAFLLMPTQQDHRIEGPLFRIAIVRKLGGRVAAKAGPDAPRRCALVAKGGMVCG